MDSFLNMKLSHKDVKVNEDVTYSCLFFYDNQNRDWYEVRKNWKSAIAVDKFNRVCGYEVDPSLLSMDVEINIYEVDPNNVPPNVISNYLYQDEQFAEIIPDDK